MMVNPSHDIKPVNLTDFGEIVRIHGTAYVSGLLPIKVAQAMADSATKHLHKHNSGIEINIEVVKDDRACGTGCGIIVMAETSTGCVLSGDAVGKKGVPSEDIGESAAEMLQTCLSREVCVDDHMQDQVVLLMALSTGTSRLRTCALTMHTKTAIFIAEKLTGAKFSVTEEVDGCCVVECVGCGHTTQR